MSYVLIACLYSLYYVMVIEMYLPHFFCHTVSKPLRISQASNVNLERAMVPVMQGLIVQQLRWQELTQNYAQERGGRQQVDYQSQHSSDGSTVEISDGSSEEEVDISMLRLPRANLFPKEPEKIPQSVSKPTTWPLLYPDDPPNYSDLLMGNTGGPSRDEHHPSPVRIRIIPTLTLHIYFHLM